jgi:hypothetical protein
MVCQANVSLLLAGAIEVVIDDSSETHLDDALWESKSLAHGRNTVRMTGHIRSVGFISKPGQIQELTTCLEGPLIDALRQTRGFAGAMILHAQKESRSLWVLTFWEAEDQAANNCWEEFPAIRKLLWPLIDLCTKVQTFQATLPRLTEPYRLGKAASVC